MANLTERLQVYLVHVEQLRQVYLVHLGHVYSVHLVQVYLVHDKDLSKKDFSKKEARKRSPPLALLVIAMPRRQSTSTIELLTNMGLANALAEPHRGWSN